MFAHKKSAAWQLQNKIEQPRNLFEISQSKAIITKIKLPFLNVLFKLLCFIGCVYLEYFAFNTTTKTTFQIDSNFDDPAIVYCTRYTDIIERTNYKKYGVHKPSRYNTTEFSSNTTKLTISDIFHLTLDSNNTIIDCEIRQDAYKPQKYLQDRCYSLFRVTKYLEGPFICYQFQTKDVRSNFKCDQAALAYAGFNVLYRITMHPRFLFCLRKTWLLSFNWIHN